jgi:hypothetical protein
LINIGGFEMNIQDSIFEVESLLEGKPESEDFKRIITYLNSVENELHKFYKIYHHFDHLKIALNNFENDISEEFDNNIME